MNELGFHESSITKFFSIDNKVVLELEGVFKKDSDQKISVRIEIDDVIKLLIDKKPANKIMMAAPDGEILNIEKQNSSLFLLIEWNNYSRGKSFTYSYDIKGEVVNALVI